MSEPATPARKKNIVIAIQSDFSGCGKIRCDFVMSYLGAVFGPSETIKPIITPTFITDKNIFEQTRSVLFQRTMTMGAVPIVEQYKVWQKTFGYKMVWDIDDYIWINPECPEGRALPDYSYCASNISTENHDASIIIANMMDECTCSTQFIKDTLIRYGVTSKITVLPNTVPQYFYGKTKRQIRETIKKPKVLYTGSGTHYDNINKKYGDFEGAYPEWIISNVLAGKIDFMVLGGLPWFLEPIKNKIKVIDWMNPYQYHLPLLAWKPDIGIAPLVPNTFNYAKSNIKHIEYCAMNACSIGSVFDGKPSPYDDNILQTKPNVTVAELNELLEKLRDSTVFNKVILDQHAYLENNGLWLESKQNIDRLVKIY